MGTKISDRLNNLGNYTIDSLVRGCTGSPAEPKGYQVEVRLEQFTPQLRQEDGTTLNGFPLNRVVVQAQAITVKKATSEALELAMELLGV